VDDFPAKFQRNSEIPTVYSCGKVEKRFATNQHFVKMLVRCFSIPGVWQSVCHIILPQHFATQKIVEISLKFHREIVQVNEITTKSKRKN
jgi:hypothetical protein